ncbi:MAG: glycoside hydrolase [Bacteroides sp.]|nr:glycoside hydrolase [Bacteroides sp.]
MRKIIRLIVLAAAGVAMPLCAQQHRVEVYPENGRPGLPHNDDYTVRVRVPGGEWKDLFEYRVQVDMDRVQDATMVQFDMDGSVEVMVKKNNGSIDRVDIRPADLQIPYQKQMNVIVFTLDKPQYLSVEFNGDRLHNLHLFANPLETETHSEGEDGVMYFGPGVHRPKDLPNNQIRVPSNTTVYLAPGAVLKAKLLVDKAENVRIVGRGILDHPVRGIEITDSRQVYVDGITVVNPEHYTVFGGGSSEVTVRNLKSFSCKGWSDGIDLMCCRNVLVDNVFMRNSDDCIALYNHRWNWWGGTENITVQNAILWADIAHPINIGGHGDPESETGETIRHLVFRNIDILEHDEDDPPYQGCMAIDAGDKNRVEEVLFEDIRVESIQEGRLFHVQVRFNAKYDKAPGTSIENVTFRNITYRGVGENPSLLKGLDKECKVKNVTFENVVINGEKMRSLDGFITNEFVEGVKIK